ncbi:MAG: pallilysin-related adhesin [Spirochaetia bacterium]
MRRIRITLPAACLIAAAALAFAGCHRSEEPRQSRVIVPRVPNDAPRGSAQSAPAGMLMAPAMPQPRITIGPGDTVLQVINASLRKSPEEEQVIAVKRMTEVDSPVRLLAVDVDPERGTYYFQSWESPTNATDNRIFGLAVKDLVGDHDVELVASGMNKDGKLTLDVFRRTRPPRGDELVYTPVCQIVADDIHVDESERPDSYASDPKNGESFSIDTYVRDPDSQNVMDLLKITYQWSPQEGRYVAGPPEKVPGEKAAQAQLGKLFNNLSPESFEDFLAGSWVEVPGDNAHPGHDAEPSELSFDSRSREIVLSTGDTQEVYSWKLTARTLYNSARIVGDNETVAQISRTFEISALSAISLSVFIEGDDSPERPTVTTYTRISDENTPGANGQPAPLAAPQSPALRGEYRSTVGDVVDFQYPRLVWKRSGAQRSAEYILFPLAGKTILSARFLGNGNGPGEDRSWVADFKEDKNPARILRTLTLFPVQLTVKGYGDAVGDTISLEQELDLRPR